MRAAVFHGREDVHVEDVDADPVGPTDVRIEVSACGICGTDLHEYNGGPIFIPEPVDPHPISGKSLPLTIGHEFSGTVSEIGEDVADLAVGDPVTVNPNVPCYDCRYCLEGSYNLCDDFTSIGLHDAGGFAENAVVPAAQAHRLPDGVPIEYGALVEPLAVGVHAVRRSGLQTGDSLAVFGSGPIGLSVIRAAREAGAKEIYVSEPKASRRAYAESIGADITLDPTDVDVVERIHERTGGGVDVAIEFAGVEATFNAAIQSTRKDGTITVGSISENTVSTDPNALVVTERTLKGTFIYGLPPLSASGEFGAVLRGLETGRIDAEQFVTGRISLEDIVEDGFEELLDPDTEHVKILVEP